MVLIHVNVIKVGLETVEVAQVSRSLEYTYLYIFLIFKEIYKYAVVYGDFHIY